VSGIDGAKSAVLLFEKLQSRLPIKSRASYQRALRSVGGGAKRPGWAAQWSGAPSRRRVKGASPAEIRRLEMEDDDVREEDSDAAAGEG